MCQRLPTSDMSGVVEALRSGSEQAGNASRAPLPPSAETEIQAIPEAVTNVADIAASVSSATEEQTQVVEEINQNITK